MPPNESITKTTFHIAIFKPGYRDAEDVYGVYRISPKAPWSMGAFPGHEFGSEEEAKRVFPKLAVVKKAKKATIIKREVTTRTEFTTIHAHGDVVKQLASLTTLGGGGHA